ncbi:DUF4956 domain-containing protein [Patescibacteria group bacterium]|nr:DUF4956 domain-containing protein [Patescibacteria group bacterium]
MENLNDLSFIAEISVLSLIMNLFLTAITAFILGIFYNKFGRSLSNKSRLATNFVSISVTTALVITIVKSSLALSLGLVGALSIVRFRTAIKEPEELAYLFLSIALGLGFGAGQKLISVVAFVIILIILFVQFMITKKWDLRNHLILSIKTPDKNTKKTIDILQSILAKYTSKSELTQMNLSSKQTNFGVRIDVDDSQKLTALLAELKEKFSDSIINVVDPDSMFG